MEDARNAGQAFDAGVGWEEATWMSEQDKADIADFVNKAVDAIEKSMQVPCKSWQLFCRVKRRE